MMKQNRPAPHYVSTLSRADPRELSALCHAAAAVDISGVLPASADQPQTHAILIDPSGNVLQVPDGLGDGQNVYDIQAFLDTGTSGIILSLETQEGLGVNLDSFDGQQTTFQDVAIGGTDTLLVSTPYTVAIAPFNINNDTEFLGTPPDLSQYNYAAGPLRMEVTSTPADELVGPLDIFGMPILQGKVAVFDLRPANSLDPDNPGETATYLFSPHEQFHAATIDDNPGVTPTEYHVKMSFGSFNQFTQTNPAGAPGPVQYANPFIGPNPLNALNPHPPVDNTPPVTISFNGKTSTGSFLFDTGAQASFISIAEALNLGVEYSGQTDSNGNPILVDANTGAVIPNQFAIPITGAGGQTVSAAGFYLDSLTLQTVEGQPLRYLGAPVLVQDISVQDPKTGQTLTLDGDLGMNFFEPSLDPSSFDFTTGPYDWATFDQPGALLGLQIAGDTLPTAWAQTSGGTWNASANWSDGSIPQAAGTTIHFTNAILANSTINLDSQWTVGNVYFQNTNSYTLAAGAGGTLTLDNGASNSFIVDAGGNHFIAAPIILNSPGWVNVVNAADTLSISGNISGTGSFTVASTGTVVLSGSNSFTGGTNVSSGTLVIASAASLPRTGPLAIGSATTTGIVQLSPGIGKVALTSLTVNPGSTLDIANNSMTIQFAAGADPTSAIAAALAAGYNHGAWTGPGITSSLAAASNSKFTVGYADGSVDVATAAASGQVLIEYTLAGDANLDGTVGFADLVVVAQNFGKTGKDWAGGNFTYDPTGSVGFADLVMVAQNFGFVAPQLAATPSQFSLLSPTWPNTSTVPEPATVLPAAISVVLLARRRRETSR